MAVFRVNKATGYTVMSNFHLRDKRMSLKAKGLLSLILSLPDTWNYSLGGLVSICIESEGAVKTALKELKQYGYLRIDKVKPTKENGGRYEYIYNIFEQPTEKQEVEIQGVEIQPLEIQPLENYPLYKETDKSNTDISITNTSSIDDKPTRKRFTPPSLEEVQAYCRERNNKVDAKKFYDYYTAADWYDGKGEKVKSWKQKVITWEGRDKKPTEQNTTDKLLRMIEEGAFDE